MEMTRIELAILILQISASSEDLRSYEEIAEDLGWSGLHPAVALAYYAWGWIADTYYVEGYPEDWGRTSEAEAAALLEEGWLP